MQAGTYSTGLSSVSCSCNALPRWPPTQAKPAQPATKKHPPAAATSAARARSPKAPLTTTKTLAQVRLCTLCWNACLQLAVIAHMHSAGACQAYSPAGTLHQTHRHSTCSTPAMGPAAKTTVMQELVRSNGTYNIATATAALRLLYTSAHPYRAARSLCPTKHSHTKHALRRHNCSCSIPPQHHARAQLQSTSTPCTRPHQRDAPHLQHPLLPSAALARWRHTHPSNPLHTPTRHTDHVPKTRSALSTARQSQRTRRRPASQGS